MGSFGTNMKNHCIIIGWNDFTKQVVDQVIKANEKVAIVIEDEAHLETIKEMYPSNQCFVFLTDLGNLTHLEKVNIRESKRVYVNFDNDTDTLVYTISLKKTFEEVQCVVAIENVALKNSFSFLGVQFIIPKNEIVSKVIASFIFEPSAALLTEDLISTSDSEENLDIRETILDKDHVIIGDKFLETFIRFKKEFNIILVSVSRKGTLIKSPEDDLIFQENDVLIYIANGKTGTSSSLE